MVKKVKIDGDCAQEPVGHCGPEQCEVVAWKRDGKPSPARILLYLLAAITVGLIGAYLAAQVYVHLYAYQQGVALSELSEDYGMAFFALLISATTFLIAVPLAYFILHKSLH